MRRFWISGQFPLVTFTDLLAKHLDTFRELERLQMTALDGVKSQGLEGLTTMLSRQKEIMTAIAVEKNGLRPFLEQWEALPTEERARLRAGRAGEILLSLENVAQAIQARHQEMFGADELGKPEPKNASSENMANTSTKHDAGKPLPAEENAPDLAQMINLYRALQ